MPRGARARGTPLEEAAGPFLSSTVTNLPADVLRSVLVLFGSAILCVVLAGLYSNPYLFDGALGQGLPDISPTAPRVAWAFQCTAVLLALWGGGIAALALPSVAVAVQRVALAPGRWEPWWAALGLALSYVAARFAFNVETMHATLQEFTDGEALLPFQYRALVSWGVRGLAEGIPALRTVDLRLLYAPFEFGAAVGAYAALAYLLRVLGRSSGTSRRAALGMFALLALNLAAPWRHNSIYFPYDTPSVAFFTLGLAFLVGGRMSAFYVLFVLATLNRETTCFLTMAYVALAAGNERTERIAGHVVTQTALWVAVKVGLSALYAGNLPLDQNTGALFSGMIVRSTWILTSVPGIVYIALVTMGGLAGVAFLLRHRVTDTRVRRLVWIIPPFLAGMAIVGEMMEVRIYSELIPLVAVALVFAARSIVLEAAKDGGLSARSGLGRLGTGITQDEPVPVLAETGA